MKFQRLLLDTDVVVNWLIKETETSTSKPLWEAPYKIIKLIENKSITGMISLTTLLEIRYLLRRKKAYTPKQVEADISKLTSIFDVVIPDEINLLKANTLQAEYPLDPFDAIQLSIAMGLSPIALVTRDREFMQISGKFIASLTPEECI